jgi:hypothetical protein
VSIFPYFFLCFCRAKFEVYASPVHACQILLLTNFYTSLYNLPSCSFWAYISENEKHMEMYSPQIIDFYNSKNNGKNCVM